MIQRGKQYHNADKKISSIPGEEFTSNNVILEHRLQAFSAVFHVCCVTLFLMAFIYLSVHLLSSPLWFISVGYWMFVYYDHCVARTSRRGGRRSQWLCSSPHLKFFANYFPIKLVKTADLDPGRNYIVAYHPHGALAMGAFCAVSCEYLGFRRMYPGVRPTLLTLKTNLLWPMVRDYALLLGLCDVGMESINWLLTKEGAGNAVVLVVGGAQEALEAKPGSHKVVLRNRKGFVRVAIQYGAPLVPVYSFGETDMFDQLGNTPGSTLRRMQLAMKRMCHYTVPVFYGRGISSNTFGFMPHRVPVNIVVGSPIEVPHDPSPTPGLVDEVHERYIAKLVELFEEHKGKYGVSSDKYLEIL